LSPRGDPGRCGATNIDKGDKSVKLRHIAVLGGLIVGGFIGFNPVTVLSAQTANQAKPNISEEASAALLRMGQALSVEQFSFQAKTICVYSEAGG
jgi:hypothetical protein